MSTRTRTAEKVKAALVGCGPRGTEHAAGLYESETVSFVACCDSRKDRCDELAQKHNVEAYYELDQMLESQAPDLVHVVTPPGRRLEELSVLEAAGVRACVIEKPVALGVQDYKALSDFEEGAAINTAVCLQGRYDAHLQEVRDAENLGKLVSVTASSRMNVVSQGVHMLDRALCLAGDPKIDTDTRVLGTVAGGWDNEAGHSAPNMLLLHALLPTGAALVGCFGPEARKAVAAPEVYMHTGIAATFESGSVYFDEFGHSHRAGPEGFYAGRTDWETWRETDKKNLMLLVDDLCNWAFAGGPQCQTNLRRTLDEWSLVLAAYQSTLNHAAVAVGTGQSPDLIDRLGGGARHGGRAVRESGARQSGTGRPDGFSGVGGPSHGPAGAAHRGGNK